MDAAQTKFLASLRQGFSNWVPHVAEIGITVEDLERDRVITRLAFRPEWLADPSRGVLHGGIMTTLIDSSCGLAVYAAVLRSERVATLDLRTDYLRPAVAEHALYCESHCFRLTTSIAFVRSTVWQADREQPVATSQGTFMRAGSRPEANS